MTGLPFTVGRFFVFRSLFERLGLVVLSPA